MSLKNFFTGKSGVRLWVNIGLMLLVLVAVPLATFYMLNTFTRHGEKIEVPSVTGLSFEEASRLLQGRGLVAAVADSVYNQDAEAGSVVEQLPVSGYEVKGGRVVYLTIAMKEAPLTRLPDVVNLGSLREAVSVLNSLGFKLTPHESVPDKPKDLVLGVKQGAREVIAGDMLPRGQVLTLMIGEGEADSLEVDTFLADYLMDEAVMVDDIYGELDTEVDVEL